MDESSKAAVHPIKQGYFSMKLFSGMDVRTALGACFLSLLCSEDLLATSVTIPTTKPWIWSLLRTTTSTTPCFHWIVYLSDSGTSPVS